MAPSLHADQTGRPGGEKGDLACNSRLFGFSSRHSLPPGSNLSCMLLSDRLTSHFLPHTVVCFIRSTARSTAQQTVFLGPTWASGGSFYYPSFLGRAVADGMLLGFSGATQWRLVAGLANRQLRSPVRRRGSTGGCWHAAGTHSVRSPQMSLWVGRRRPGPPCHGLQESTW